MENLQDLALQGQREEKQQLMTATVPHTIIENHNATTMAKC